MIAIHPRLKESCPALALGIVRAQVRVTAHEPALWEEIDAQIAAIPRELSLDRLPALPEIKATRDAYAALGKDPSKYRGSAEALLRRVLQGKGLYRVNTPVDINNLVSLTSRHPVGSYDLSRLAPPLTFRIGEPGETYKGIGKEMINIADLPVFADAAGPYGSPTSDSERAMISDATTDFAMVVIAFSGAEGLDGTLAMASRLLRAHAGAAQVDTSIVA